MYTICKMLDEGHTLVGILHMRSVGEYSDSYMFQTVGSEIAELIGQCLECPLFIHSTRCIPSNKMLDYSPTDGDEVEDLFDALKHVLESVRFEAVCSGAIHSTYQKNRVANVCGRLGLHSVAPLWGREQRELLKEMVEYGMDARIIKIASPVLAKACLGMALGEIYEYLQGCKSVYELNYCGEGGEYETIVLDCKFFKKRIVIVESEVCCHPEEKDKDGSVFYMKLSGLRTEKKL